VNQPDSWQSSTVEKFFQNFHWQGYCVLSASEREIQAAKDKTIPWQCLTVEKFLRCYNWQGQLLSETSEEQSLGIKKSTLMFSVKEFMRSIDWDGNPKIGALPE
jgi:hypothetical protein